MILDLPEEEIKGAFSNRTESFLLLVSAVLLFAIAVMPLEVGFVFLEGCKVEDGGGGSPTCTASNCSCFLY